MEFAFRQIGSAYVITLSGRLDAFSSQGFEQSALELVRNNGMSHAVLDLSQVDYVSSFGLRAILGLGKALAPGGGALHVTGLHPSVRKVFTGSGFDSLFPEFPSVPEAVEAFTSEPE